MKDVYENPWITRYRQYSSVMFTADVINNACNCDKVQIILLTW